MIPASRLTIDLGRYRRNLQVLRRRLSARTRLCAVVKADAYGHGLVRIAQAAQEEGVDVLGIVDNAEAARLREAGITLPIIRLRPAIPDEVEEATGLGVEEIVGDMGTAERFSRLAAKREAPIRVHVKIDVGIGRMGISAPEAERLVRRVLGGEGLRLSGLMTHFPSADDSDESVTLGQLRVFESILEKITRLVGDDVVVHAANSAAALRFPQTHFGMARLGLATYGLSPSAAVILPQGILPVMRWTTRIAQLRGMRAGETVGYGMTCRLDRDCLVAGLPVGYADGYFWSLSGTGEVVVRGRRCRILGRVSMDLICVDVSQIPGVSVGDEVVLMGDSITATELAARAGTISYDIVTRTGGVSRTERIYVESALT